VLLKSNTLKLVALSFKLKYNKSYDINYGFKTLIVLADIPYR